MRYGSGEFSGQHPALIGNHKAHGVRPALPFRPTAINQPFANADFELPNRQRDAFLSRSQG